MPGFYETIVKAEGPLTALWITEGENAGARALRGPEGMLFRDEAFPPEETGEAASARVFRECLSKGKRLVLCGAGHVALCVIRLGVLLGYEVTVVEDRAEYAEKAREASAHGVVC